MKMADINAIDFIQFINIVLLSFFLFHSIRLRYLQSQSYFHAAKFSFLFPQMICQFKMATIQRIKYALIFFYRFNITKTKITRT